MFLCLPFAFPSHPLTTPSPTHVHRTFSIFIPLLVSVDGHWSHYSVYMLCSYLMLLCQYEAVSFCDALFANYVLLPLQQSQSVLLRKAVWGDHVTILHSLSLPANQVTTTTTTTTTS